MNIEERKRFMQDVHTRYIIDHFTSGRKISSRKTYLIHKLGLSLLSASLLLVIFPNLKNIFLGIIIIVAYLFGIEIGRRYGYVKAYVSLIKNYDNNYIDRWKELRDKDQRGLAVTQDEAYKNTENFLKNNDFPVNVDFPAEE